MAKSSVVHATFVVERTFEATPAEVFNAFADPKAKAQWFVGPSDRESGPREFDFRVGGRSTDPSLSSHGILLPSWPAAEPAIQRMVQKKAGWPGQARP
jgi:hypothetical protein